jgi:hypothetical protein
VAPEPVEVPPEQEVAPTVSLGRLRAVLNEAKTKAKKVSLEDKGSHWAIRVWRDNGTHIDNKFPKGTGQHDVKYVRSHAERQAAGYYGVPFEDNTRKR